ncbi:hypothetical protein [Kitasatospora sp. NPDC050463]|uniref:hypothetical protein n=1 Tax=Kitasatospora sp. NPDC050463 TaxID=3155786 RepID=UPI0033FC1A1E
MTDATVTSSAIYNATELKLNDFLSAMLSSPCNPRPVRIEVGPEFVRLPAIGIDGADPIAIQLIPTMIKMMAVKEFVYYQYEFEGWLVGDYPERDWVYGELQLGSDDGELCFAGIARTSTTEERAKHLGLRPYFPVSDPESFVYPST